MQSEQKYNLFNQEIHCCDDDNIVLAVYFSFVENFNGFYWNCIVQYVNIQARIVINRNTESNETTLKLVTRSFHVLQSNTYIYKCS